MKKVKQFEEYNLSEKKITLTWNDDDNSIVFSDGEIASVDYDGEFQYRDEWFSTVDHTEADDLIRDLEKRFKRDKFEWISESYVNEGKVKVFLDKIVSRMVEKGLGVHYDYRMRQEIKEKIEAAVKETMEKYDYIVEGSLNEDIFRTYNEIVGYEFDKFKKAYLELHKDNEVIYDKKDDISYGLRKSEKEPHWKYFHDDFKLYHSEKDRDVLGLINFKKMVLKGHPWSK